jgi:tetratricopeptide (TPR) repeat protein
MRCPARVAYAICVTTLSLVQPVAAADEPVQALRPVLILRSNLPSQHLSGWLGDLLLRELPRQTVLNVARDDLNLNTRDGTLREPTNTAAGAVRHELDIHTTSHNGELTVRLDIVRNGESEKIWETTFDQSNDYNIQFLRLIGDIERSRPAIKAALEKAGITAGPAEEKSAPVASEDLAALERQLADLSLTSQYACLRKSHALLRSHGQSPELLSILARAYAQLNQLTFFHWTGAYSAFQGRALLYAERLVAAHPESPLAVGTRAYARTWTGLHAGALADLEAAEKLQAGKPDSPAPAWLALVRPTCEYRAAELTALGEAQPELAQQAACLAYLAVEAAATQPALEEAAARAIEKVPYCYRLRSSLNERGSRPQRDAATIEASRHWNENLAESLEKLADLPPSVLEVARRPAPTGGFLNGLLGRQPTAEFGPKPVKVAQALVAAAETDDQEFGWGVLGRLIEETNFALVAHRFNYLRLPTYDVRPAFVQQALAAVEQHPFRPWFEAYRFDFRGDRERFQRVAGEMVIHDARPSMEPMLVDLLWLASPGKPEAQKQRDHASWYTSQLAYDLESRLEYIPYGKPRDMSVQVLAKVSPYSPVGIGELLELDDPVDESQFKVWEERFVDYPKVAGGLAHRYQTLGRKADAERLLKRLLEQDPSEPSFTRLANFYWWEGNEAKYLETLEKFLEQPEKDLTHARVRVRLANYLMGRGRFRQAEPFAVAAAQSHAAWALKCAGCCYEGLGKLEDSERWWRTVSERYESERTAWYFWCRRTGMGDSNAAYALAKQKIDDLESQGAAGDLSIVAAFYVVSNDLPKAVEVLQTAVVASPWPWNSLHLTLLADEQGDLELRDRTLGKLVAEGDELTAEGRKYHDQANLVRLAKLLQTAYAANEGKEPSLDLEAVDKLIKEAGSESRADLGYFVGKFLSLHDQDDAAVEYWRRSAALIEDRFNIDLSGAELTTRGVSSWRAEQRKD